MPNRECLDCGASFYAEGQVKKCKRCKKAKRDFFVSGKLNSAMTRRLS